MTVNMTLNNADSNILESIKVFILTHFPKVSFSMDELSPLEKKLLNKKGYVSLEKYFVDETKIENVANKYTFVWKKAVGKTARGIPRHMKSTSATTVRAARSKSFARNRNMDG